MRGRLLIVVLAIVFSVGIADAQDRGVGAGVIVGDPTGISLKIWTSGTNAAQFAVAWQTRDRFLGTRVSFSGDYLWHSFNVIRSEQRFPIYYGVGGVIAAGGGPAGAFGVRGVVGIDWLSRQAPVDVFFQVVPVMVLTPSTDLELGAGLGIRYFFE